MCGSASTWNFIKINFAFHIHNNDIMYAYPVGAGIAYIS